jgi:hypothetical protein
MFGNLETLATLNPATSETSETSYFSKTCVLAALWRALTFSTQIKMLGNLEILATLKPATKSWQP